MNMNRIYDFVSNIYKDFDGNEKEIQELKEEMISHLLEAVNELKTNGKSENEAIDIALKRFGDEKAIANGLFGLYKAQRYFTKKIFQLSLIFLILGLLAVFGLITADYQENKNMEEFKNEVFKITDQKFTLSSIEKENIESLVNKADMKVSFLALKQSQGNNQEITFGKQQRSEIFKDTSNGWEIQFQFSEKYPYTLLFNATNTLLTIFIVLFAVQTAMKLYHKRNIKLFQK